MYFHLRLRIEPGSVGVLSYGPGVAGRIEPAIQLGFGLPLQASEPLEKVDVEKTPE